MNSDLGKALLFILLLNVSFFMIQLAIADQNITSMNGTDVLEGQVNFYNYDTSMLKTYDEGNYSLKESLDDEIPDGTKSIDANNNNFFTDTWQTLRGWILEVPGANTIYNIVNALPHFLTAMGMDFEIVFALGFLWHSLTVFLIVSWIKGG